MGRPSCIRFLQSRCPHSAGDCTWAHLPMHVRLLLYSFCDTRFFVSFFFHLLGTPFLVLYGLGRRMLRSYRMAASGYLTSCVRCTDSTDSRLHTLFFHPCLRECSVFGACAEDGLLPVWYFEVPNWIHRCYPRTDVCLCVHPSLFKWTPPRTVCCL